MGMYSASRPSPIDFAPSASGSFRFPSLALDHFTLEVLDDRRSVEQGIMVGLLVEARAIWRAAQECRARGLVMCCTASHITQL